MRPRLSLLPTFCISALLGACAAGLVEAGTNPATPISSARSRTLQISSVFLDDRQEEAFVFPQRLDSETAISAFDVDDGSTLGVIAGERWRLAWGSRGVTGSGQHHSLILARSGNGSAVGLSVGASISDRAVGSESWKTETEFWTWHASLGASVAASRSSLDLAAGAAFSKYRQDLLWGDAEDLRERELEKGDPGAFVQIRFARSYSDSRIVLAGGFFDQRETWDLRDLQLTPPVVAENDAYGHAWYAGILLERETSRRAIARFGASYYVDRDPYYVTEGRGNYREARSETRSALAGVSLERKLVRRVLGRVSIGRAYTFTESKAGLRSDSRWDSSDSFAWGLEYRHRWFRLGGLLKYDLGLDAPFVALDVSVRP